MTLTVAVSLIEPPMRDRVIPDLSVVIVAPHDSKVPRTKSLSWAPTDGEERVSAMKLEKQPVEPERGEVDPAFDEAAGVDDAGHLRRFRRPGTATATGWWCC